jgi:hypothetical protein
MEPGAVFLFLRVAARGDAEAALAEVETEVEAAAIER